MTTDVGLRRRSLMRLAAAAGVAALLVTGCAAVPSSSPVRQGEAVGGDREAGAFIRVLARPPAPGADQTQIVSGFLAASAAFEANHEVTRQYLAPEIREAWDTSVGTVVYDPTSLELAEAADDAEVALTAGEVARISGRGEYAASGAGTQVAAQYDLRQVDGEWRISRLPSGLLLSTLDVARAFRSFSLMFVDASGVRLVPDNVVVPAALPGVSTTLVRALLAGPTPWLAPAVNTAFPSGTSLSAAAVPITDGIATVQLSADVLSAGPDARRQLSAQLVWTLRQLPEVTGVRIRAGDSALAVPGADEIQGRDAWPSFDPDGLPADATAYAVVDGALVSGVGDAAEPVPGPLGDGSLLPRSVAISLDGSAAATLDGPGLLVGQWETFSASPVLSGTDLTRPTWDPFDTVWVVDRTATGPVVWRVRLGGSAEAVEADELQGRRVLDFRMARDGARAAIILEEDGKGLLFVARIEREADGIRIGALRRVESELVDVRQVSWSDATSLAVLARSERGTLEPFVIDPNTTVTAPGSLPEVRSLAAAPARPLLAVTANAQVWVDRGFGWRAEGSATEVAYPG
jgi:hypothetical protein